jgi:hypothetical protein
MFPLDPLVVWILSFHASLTKVANESASIRRLMFSQWIWIVYSAICDASIVVHDIDKVIRRFDEGCLLPNGQLTICGSAVARPAGRTQ